MTLDPLSTALAHVTEPHTESHPDGADESRTADVRALRSEQLFLGSREVRIEHGGAIYRLKQTSLGKLILTK